MIDREWCLNNLDIIDDFIIVYKSHFSNVTVSIKVFLELFEGKTFDEAVETAKSDLMYNDYFNRLKEGNVI